MEYDKSSCSHSCAGIPLHADKCSSCGEKQSVDFAEQARKNVCKHYAAELPADARFCCQCGERVDSSSRWLHCLWIIALIVVVLWRHDCFPSILRLFRAIAKSCGVD